jgi:uncharacterized protein YfkK (UPF0435 family)
MDIKAAVREVYRMKKKKQLFSCVSNTAIAYLIAEY